MLKYLILLVNIPVVFLLNLLPGNEVTITHNLPEKASPNSEFIVELVIDKGEIEGFAKIEQQLPNGFKATALETAGASFTFSGGTLKLIWMELPSESPFSVSYKVAVEGSVNGAFDITGNMSYLVNNEKSETPIPKKTIQVGEGEKMISASAKRNIIPLNENEYKVEIQIKSEGISGFAKVEEILPSGISAAGGMAKDAVFSFVGGKAKFVWMSIPEESEITISYIAELNESNKELLNDIKGEFSYLNDNATKKITIETISESFTNEMLAEETEPPIEEETGEEEEEITVESTTPEIDSNNLEETEEPVTNIPEPEKNVSYKVQVCAGHKQVNNNHFKLTYNFEEEKIAQENHEGWIKYTIGKYDVYKSAKERRNEVDTEYNFPGPFVTAYNQGKRITVQEGLMITSQDWVK